MLISVEAKHGVIELTFDAKTGGKFRFKKLQDFKNPYSAQLKKDELSKSKDWYLEWMITYYVGESSRTDKGIIDTLFIDEPVELIKSKDKDNKNLKKIVYPYELPGLYLKALEIGLLSKENCKNLADWVCSAKETLYEKHNISSTEHDTIKLNGLDFNFYKIEIPLLVLKNMDGTWIEIFLQKQQFAYGIQGFVFLCIPNKVFSRKEDKLVWKMDKNNVTVLDNLFKAFASASESHRQDVCRILEVICASMSSGA